LFLDGLWERALPAADFDFLLVLPSRRTLEAELAAFFEVTFFGALVCDNALPEAAFDLLPVFLLRRVFEAFLAALGRVTLDLAILSSPNIFKGERMGQLGQFHSIYLKFICFCTHCTVLSKAGNWSFSSPVKDNNFWSMKFPSDRCQIPLYSNMVRLV